MTKTITQEAANTLYEFVKENRAKIMSDPALKQKYIDQLSQYAIEEAPAPTPQPEPKPQLEPKPEPTPEVEEEKGIDFVSF